MKESKTFLNLGYNNALMLDKIIAIVNADSKPARRLKSSAQKEGRLIDATNGRKTRALIIVTTNHIVLSAANPQTLIERVNENKK